MQGFKLPKSEKLRHKSLVDKLFAEGVSFYDFPLRVTVRRLDDDALSANFKEAVPDRIGPVQMLITVPKRKLRHAVDRVTMRRRIREAYRLNRMALREAAVNDDSTRTLGMAFVYMHDKKLPYKTIERKMKLLLSKINNKVIPQPPKETEDEN